MKGVLAFFIGFSLITAGQAFGYEHKVLKVLKARGGYQKLWLEIKIGTHDPVRLSLPLCNRASVKRLDQYCATRKGLIAFVTAIKDNLVFTEEADLSTTARFSEFADRVSGVNAPSRMPASVPQTAQVAAVSVTCEASCPQLDFSTACKATAETKEAAFIQLKSEVLTQSNPACKMCNVKSVVCNGTLYPKSTDHLSQRR